MEEERKKEIELKKALADRHPAQAEIFRLEILLIEGGFPYWFNFWEDAKPLWEEVDPDNAVDWDTYKFLLEVGRPAGSNLAEISVCLDRNNKGKLELLDMRYAEEKENLKAEDGNLFAMLTAEDCYERIKDFYEKM